MNILQHITIKLGICILLTTFTSHKINAHKSINLFNGPDITGKYEFNRFGITGAYLITKTTEGIYIEKYDTGKDYANIAKAGSYPEFLVGDYNWESTRGAFMQTNSSINPKYKGSKFLLFKVNNKTLAVRNSTGEIGIFKKIQGSLSDLVNSKRTNVSHLIGNWNVAQTNANISLTKGVDFDLRLRYGKTIYQLNKEQSGVFETYTGKSNTEEDLHIKVLGANKIKLTLHDNTLIATKTTNTKVSNGVNTKKTSPNNSTATQVPYSQLNRNTLALSEADKLMFKAIKEIDEEALKELFDAGVNINAKNRIGRTPLHEAILTEDTYIIETVLDQNPNLNLKNNQGRTALETAITKSDPADISIINMLLEQQPHISSYALDKALEKNNDNLITALIDAGASINYLATKAIDSGKIKLFNTLIDNHNLTPTSVMFDKALLKNKIALAENMLENNFDPQYAMKAGIRTNKIDVVYAALEHGGNATSAMKYGIKVKDQQLVERAITEFDANPKTGLELSVLAKNTDLAAIMLNNGTDPNTQIINVAKSGHIEMLNLFLNNNANPNLGLIPAANAGKSKAVSLLLKHEADPNPLLDWSINKNATQYVKQAIAYNADASITKYIAQAASRGNIEIVTALLNAGAKPDNGLLAATKGNKLNVVIKLIQSGGNANSDNLLAASSTHNNPLLTDLFIKAGANPQVGLIPAVNNNASKTLQLLINNGANIENQSLLLTSVKNTCTPCAHLLITEGLKAEYQDPTTGKYLLHYAAEKSNAEMIRLLLKNHAQVDPVSSGNTPLHLAVKNRKGLAAVEALIQGGANVNAKNSKGKKVLRIAKGSKIKKRLKQAGATKK